MSDKHDAKHEAKHDPRADKAAHDPRADKAAHESVSNATKPPPRRARRVAAPARATDSPPAARATDSALAGLAEFLLRDGHAAVIETDLVERYVNAFFEWLDGGDALKTEIYAQHLVACMDANNPAMVRAVMQASLQVNKAPSEPPTPARPRGPKPPKRKLGDVEAGAEGPPATQALLVGTQLDA